MTGLALFAPPTRQPLDGLLDLGARVRWSHRAAVIRRRPLSRYTTERGDEWCPVEGVESYWRPPIGVEASKVDPSDWMYAADDEWYRRPVADGRNKSVLVWPEDGDGVVIGYTRRGIGQSWSAQSGVGLGEYGGMGEPEPGGFASSGFVHLYQTKASLTGSVMLVPTWAVMPIVVGVLGAAYDVQDGREPPGTPDDPGQPVASLLDAQNASERDVTSCG